uniref:Uncharacterized protein n=1 Tax=Anguilla anguilla TaxID=7936 RepID=A0A0E9VNC0_ANGAN
MYFLLFVPAVRCRISETQLKQQTMWLTRTRVNHPLFNNCLSTSGQPG